MSLQIKDLENVKVRSLLRGLLGAKSREDLTQTIEAIGRIASAKDLAIVGSLLSESALFNRHMRDVDFPKTPRTTFLPRTRTIFSLEKELTLVTARIETEKERILTFVQHLKVLNEALLFGTAEDVLKRLKNIRENFGYSLLYLNKLAFALAIFPDNFLRDFCVDELGKYGLRGRNPLAVNAVDIVGETYSFHGLRRNFIEYTNEHHTNSILRDIINWQYRPVRSDAVDVACQLRSQSHYSLIDAFIFIGTHAFNTSILQRLGQSAQIKMIFDTEFMKTWNQMADDRSFLESERIVVPNADNDDFHFYRRSLAFYELRSITNWRNGIDAYFAEEAFRGINAGPESVDFLDKYYVNIRHLGDLCASTAHYHLSIDEFDQEHSGLFCRTLGFMHLLKRGHKCDEIDSVQLLVLLNKTRDVALTINPSILRQFFESAPPSSLTNYLANAVMADATKISVDQHKFRRSLQKIVSDDFGCDLIRFTNYLFASAPLVAEHLVHTCTVSFLSQLFFLFEDTESIYNTRASLMEWYADHFSEPSYRERAKTLRLDQKLQQIKGDIDDTRMYVDPLKFEDWIEANEIEELNTLLHLGLIEVKEVEKFRTIGDVTTSRLPHIRLASALQRSYIQFCTDKQYGIDSYLGRRIRHGTLKGVMVVQVRSLLAQKRYEVLLRENPVGDYFNAWVSEYERSVLFIGTEYLQIASRTKPDGSISVDITAPDKVDAARTAMKDIIQIYNEEKSAVSIGTVIFEHCWRFLEKDLRAIRNVFEIWRVRSQISRQAMRTMCIEEHIPLAIELARNIEAIIDEKFATLTSWFVKPQNLAPSAPISMLIDVVLREMGEIRPTYKPSVEKTGISDISIIGVIYHNVYDFLHESIQNAAKHGKQNGSLSIDISFGLLDNGIQELIISVGSEIAEGQTLKEVEMKIDRRLAQADDDAPIVEGRGSGLIRLQGLTQGSSRFDSIGYSFFDRIVTARCVMKLPVS